MTRPQIPIDEAAARFRYTAAQSFASGNNQRQTVARMREVYPQLSASEALRFAREGRNANTLADAYLSGDDAAVQAASADQPQGTQGRRVLSVNVIYSDPNNIGSDGRPEQTARTARIEIEPGESAESVRDRLNDLIQLWDSGQRLTLLGFEALSALDL